MVISYDKLLGSIGQISKTLFMIQISDNRWASEDHNAYIRSAAVGKNKLSLSVL